MNVQDLKTRTWVQHSWRYLKDTVIQDHDSVQSILINFGIVAALLISILMTTMVSVPIEEGVYGDILSMALSSPHFRCHFASPTDTIEICSASFTTAMFGSTIAAVLCKNGASMPPISGRKWTRFYCAGDIPRAIRGGGGLWEGETYEPGCSTSSFKEAARVAMNISESDYLAYMMEELPASDQEVWTSWFGFPGKFDSCRPTGRLATLAFKALLFLMFALFWDLYLLVSLTFSNASQRTTEMRLWWLTGGTVGALGVMAMLLNGTIHFLKSIEYLVMLRFPSPYDQLLYKIDFMDTFIFYGIWMSGIAVGVHFLGVRFDWIIVKLWYLVYPRKDAENGSDQALPRMVEMQEIRDKKNRKLLFYAKLDVHRLLAVLNDTMLLNSVLLDAGIKSPGDRIEIIMILKDIERDSRAERIASPLPLGT